jgi:3-oxoacyl-[acyl-carrier-protein] synthase-3
MSVLSLVDAASYMPPTVVDNSFFGHDPRAVGHEMFRGPRSRHLVDEGETTVGMIEKASRKLAARLGISLKRDVDIILVNAPFHDSCFAGSGASLCRALDCDPRWVLDLANTGCVSFVFMLELARSLMATSSARTALVCNVQHTAGRIFAQPQTRQLPQSAIPGDGCGVAYLVANGENPVRSVVTRVQPEYADDMRARCDGGNAWWEMRDTPMYIDFNPDRLANIVKRGITLVPEMIRQACMGAELPPEEIDLLITNQPNRTFLQKWRESLGLSEESHVHTFEEHGNLFGAAMPVCLEQAIRQGRLRSGSHLAIGGFSHAGDYAGAAIVEWNAS